MENDTVNIEKLNEGIGTEIKKAKKRHCPKNTINEEKFSEDTKS